MVQPFLLNTVGDNPVPLHLELGAGTTGRDEAMRGEQTERVRFA